MLSSPLPGDGIGLNTASFTPNHSGINILEEVPRDRAPRAGVEEGSPTQLACGSGNSDGNSANGDQSDKSKGNTEEVFALTAEEIGDSGMVFLRLARTRAFSNYCYEKTARGESRRVADIKEQYQQQLARNQEQLEAAAAGEDGRGASPDLQAMLETASRTAEHVQ